MFFNSEEIKSGEKNVDLFRTIYTYHQLYNIKATAVYDRITEFAMYSCIILIIFFSYIFFRYTNAISIQLLCFCGFLMGFMGLKFALTLAAACHASSQQCIDLSITNSALSKNQYNKQFWKSRRPFSFRVGSRFKIETNTYVLKVFGEIVPNNLVNLLLTF